ncbi:MAG: hypothetical protein OXJ36_18495 [bacterium]|nr:hypothetical protein [bacterium]
MVVAAVLAGSWWELLFLPLGASHDGRINGRFGLHVRNLLEHGLVNSDFLASMAPFSNDPYTHHPPLLNVLHAVLGSLLGQGEWQLHAIGYLAGLGTVAGLLWLARELDLGPWSSVLVMALVASTPMFWIYGRLGLGVSVLLVLLALWHRHHRLGRGYRVLLIASGLAALSSWLGAGVAVLVSGLGMREAGRRKAALAVGGVGVSTVLAVLVWAAVAGDATELARHTMSRLRWPSPADLLENYLWFYRTLFPRWFRLLILPAIAVALIDRRTRMAAGTTAAALTVWTLIAPGGALIHDFWTYPLLLPVFLGLAVMADHVERRLESSRIALGVAATLVLLAAVGLGRLPPYRDAYFQAPSDAGALLRESAPARGQAVAWVAEGVDPVPRWVSYYWDLPAIELSPVDVEAVGDADLVLVRVDQAPPWIGTPVAVFEKGRYALVTGSALRASG